MNSVIHNVDEDGIMQTVERFEGFEFTDPEKADLMILYQSTAQEQGREILGEYGSFALCR